MACLGAIPSSHVSLELGKRRPQAKHGIDRQVRTLGCWQICGCWRDDSHNLLISSVELRGIEPRTS
jgi:hypothetical protein